MELELKPQIITSLVARGWTEIVNGVAIASRFFRTAVGPREALIYSRGHSSGEGFYLTAEYISEGGNILESTRAEVKEDADSAIEDFTRAISKRIAQSYAGRLGKTRELTAYVCVVGEPSKAEDDDVPGVYAVDVTVDDFVVVDALSAEEETAITHAVKNAFHLAVPIAEPEAFEISYRLDSGYELFERMNPFGVTRGKLEEKDIPAAVKPFRQSR